MTGSITRDNPLYWGTPIPLGGTTRASGADRMQIERNETPSVAWQKLPTDSEGVINAIEDHVQTRLQFYLQLVIYLHNSGLRLRKTTAPNQVTSGEAVEETEEAHTHLLAGIACTTVKELETKGMEAVWVQLAGGSHLGKGFQTTHRLWSDVNKTDTALESTKSGMSGITLREFALESCRLVAEGCRSPTAAWMDFISAHAFACGALMKGGSTNRKAILGRYLDVLTIYRKRFGENKTVFVKLVAMSGSNDPDDAKYVARFQKRIAREIWLGALYSQLVGKAKGADGADQCYPEQVNAFLTALVKRVRITATPFLQPKATTGTSRGYVDTLEASDLFQKRVACEVVYYGPLEVARQIGKKVSPLKQVGIDVLDKSPQQVDRIIFEATHRIVRGTPKGRPRPANATALARFLMAPLLLTHFQPSCRQDIAREWAKFDLRLRIRSLVVERIDGGGESLQERLLKVSTAYMKAHVPPQNGVFVLDAFLKRCDQDWGVIVRANGQPLPRMLSRYQEGIVEEQKALRKIALEGMPSRKPQLAPRSLFVDAEAKRIASELLGAIGALPPLRGAKRRLNFGKGKANPFLLEFRSMTDQKLAALFGRLPKSLRVVSLIDPDVTPSGLLYFVSILPKRVAALWIEGKHNVSKALTDKCEAEAEARGNSLACIALSDR